MAGGSQPSDIQTAPPVQVDTSAADAAIEALQRKVRQLKAEMAGVPSVAPSEASPLAQMGGMPASPTPGGGGQSYSGGGSVPAPAPGPGNIGSALSAYRFYREQNPPPVAAYANEVAAKPSQAAGYMQSAEVLRLTRVAERGGVFTRLGSVAGVARQFGVTTGGVGGLNINPFQLGGRLLGVAGAAAGIYAATRLGNFVGDATLPLLNEQLADPTTLDLTAASTGEFANRITTWAEDTGRSILGKLYAPVRGVGRGGFGALGVAGATAAATFGAEETARDIAEFAVNAADGLDAVAELISRTESEQWEKTLAAAKRRAEETSKDLANYMLGQGFPGTRREIEAAVREIAVNEAEMNNPKRENVANADAIAARVFGATE